MQHIILIAIFTILLIPGIVMAFLPAVPSMVYMLLVALIFGFVDSFTHLTASHLGVLTIIAVLGMFLDFISGVVGAKYGGAHWLSLIWGIVGLIIGSIFIPVPVVGSIAGFFLGIFAAEWYRTRSLGDANRAATGGLIGTVLGAVLKAILSVVFIALFVYFVL